MKRAEFTWDKIEIRPRVNQKPPNSSESTRRVREGLEEQPNGPVREVLRWCWPPLVIILVYIRANYTFYNHARFFF